MIPFYSLCYRDQTKREHLSSVAQHIRLPIILHEGLASDDYRLKGLPPEVARLWSITFGHIDIIRHFVDTSTADFAIFTEHDILVHKDFSSLLTSAVDGMVALDLDVLLLGYLKHPNGPSLNPIHQQGPLTFYSYPDDQWGAQMYMLTKAQAKWITDHIDVAWAHMTRKSSNLPPFNPDWMFTKFGKRACVTPMLALEDGLGKYEHVGHGNFHRQCFEHNYRSDLYI